MKYHLAQYNVARLLAPLDSPQLSPFMEALDPLNSLADRSPGFVWRHQTEDGNSTSIRVQGDPAIIINFSVWESVEDLFEYAYHSDHTPIFRRRKEFFEHMELPYLVLWWVPAGHEPTVEEAEERLDYIREHGPTPHAFTFKKRFPPPAAGEPDPAGEAAREPVLAGMVEEYTNELGQPVGAPMPGWVPRPRPARTAMEGRYSRLEPLDAVRHADELYEAHALDADGRNWTYLPYGPFASRAEIAAWISSVQDGDDPLFFAIIDLVSGRAVGTASYLRNDPAMGSIEVGHLAYSPALQRTAAATEAMYLMMLRAFEELGYRRYEWKCNALNWPSRKAAERLGFVYEGTFRQAVVVKGRNRDTAWFSIIDSEWPAVRFALEGWLHPSNFDNAGTQRRTLQDFRRGAGG